MALAGNGRWTYLDPKLGAMHAVAEAARKVACTGATPVAATNCLNFGNPEKPEIMAQLSQAIDGIAEACNALGTPVTGGNVSLYNETKGEGIYPTPVLGVVGILEDVTKAVPNSFQKIGDDVLLLIFAYDDESEYARIPAMRQLGSSEFAKVILREIWGTPPILSLADAHKLNNCMIELADQRLISSARDTDDGAVLVSVAESTFANNIGFESLEGESILASEIPAEFYWLDFATTVIVSCSPQKTEEVISLALKHGATGAYRIGRTVREKFVFHAKPQTPKWVDSTVSELRAAWSGALESQLAAEVVTA